MSICYQDDTITLWHGDCLDVLRVIPDRSVDAVVTDPPYGLEFMGKAWDRHDSPRAFQDWCEQWAAECLRVLKPGGHMLAFGGTRTWHRLACAVEDVGFEVRDSIAWMYGSGFSKSWNFKTMHKGEWCSCTTENPQGLPDDSEAVSSAGALDDGALRDGPICPRCGGLDRVYRGFGTGIKPAFEPVVVARKPLTGTVSANVLAWGTGALNIDGCRIESTPEDKGKRVTHAHSRLEQSARKGKVRGDGSLAKSGDVYGTYGAKVSPPHDGGRWPANVVLDGVMAERLDQQSISDPDEVSGASRFFYVAKADSSERPKVNGTAHPTVKPLTLMRWLVRLVTPPGGTVLEPFAGSGTTVEACILEGFRCVAIERGDEYLPLIMQRIHRQRNPVEAIRQQGDDLGLFAEIPGDGAGDPTFGQVPIVGDEVTA